MDIFPCVIIIAPCSRLMMGQAMEADAHPRQADRLKALERENRELRQANEILRKASAYFAQAELDRPFKR